jgi:methylmalonyl-CoA/ethylmalonyl-CoA epimerase
VLSRIHHIGVAVRSADAALGLYRDALGLQVTKDAVLTDQGVRGVLVDAGETEIELLEPLRDDSAVGRFLRARGEGMHHCCFATDDITSELQLARERGLPLVDEQPRPGLAGMIAFLHPKATRGVLIEYAQPPAGASHEAAIARDVGFDHVAVAVSDLDAAAGVFARNFDIREAERRDWPVLGIRAARLPIGGGWIGVVKPLTEQTPVGRFVHDRGEGLYLISLSVSRLADMLSKLARGGISCTEPVLADPITQMAFIRPRDAAGVLIQLVEHAA